MEIKICEQCGISKSIKAFGISRDRCIACTDLSYRLRLKLKFLEMYGKICNCCGQSDPRFLTLDHVNNDGAEHRRTLSDDTSGALRVALLKHRPDLYQILCFNCNLGRAANRGLCPHKALPLEEYLDSINKASERLNKKRNPEVSVVEAKAIYDKMRKMKKFLDSLNPEATASILALLGKEEMQ